MKIKILLLFVFPTLIFAQVKMIAADFDGDQIIDKVYVEEETGTVAYELSSQKFKKVQTSYFVDQGSVFLHPKKNGFEVSINQMRAGNSFQFRYEKESQKMRLIGMWRTEYGPANNDGSGESSVNLLTNSYIAEWNYYNTQKNQLMKIPTMKKKMILPKTYFEDIGDVFSVYMEKDVQYFLAEKKRLYRK